MACIPEATWLIKKMRRSDSAAVRKCSFVLAVESPATYGTRQHKKSTDITACPPIKYKSTTVMVTSSREVKAPEKASFTASSSSRWTSLDIRSTTCPVENFNKGMFAENMRLKRITNTTIIP